MAAPIVSAVGGGLASVAAGGGRVEKMIRSGILAWGAWKAVGMAANSSVGRSIQAAAAAFRVDYNNELRLAGGNMKRFDSAVRAVGLTAKRTWARMGADLAASLKGPAIMAAIAAISYAVSELYRVGSDAFGHVPKDVQEKEKILAGIILILMNGSKRWPGRRPASWTWGASWMNMTLKLNA